MALGKSFAYTLEEIRKEGHYVVIRTLDGKNMGANTKVSIKKVGVDCIIVQIRKGRRLNRDEIIPFSAIKSVSPK